MNLLSKESSPYLLQHANNPVHWKAWNNVALQEAKNKNKLIVLSVGYSACHWCHVMEHESFEDEEVAAVMNNYFVNIKVDREERPDVDAVYMKAVQLMTQSGGWPLNIIALPDGRPIWGGTYFRKHEWIDTLEQLQKMYQNQPQKVIEYAEKLHQGIQSISSIENLGISTKVDDFDLTFLVEKWKVNFDWDFGGMARSPKFMMPNNYNFLLRFAHQKKDAKLLEFVNLTLTKMAYGGIFDTVGGGFSRYSVDNKWHVPHFEKMLYDNGQLVSLYSDAFKLTKNPLYKTIIQKTLTFVERDLMNPEGGFFCALDADSLTPENELEEGAFYVWKIPELKSLIGDDFELFSQVFNINSFGLWEDGNYVLIQNKSIDEIAEKNQISTKVLETKKILWEEILFKNREKRHKPRLDDKCLTSWNAIMLKGFVDAFKALGESQYLEIALKNADFICEKLWSKDGFLYHNYKNGNSTINGYLEDYSLIITAFIGLYEVSFDQKWLDFSKQLTDYCFEYFYDENPQFFTFTSKLDDALISQHFETEDNVIPASNSIMAKNLFQLGLYFEDSNYSNVSYQMLQNILPTISYPSAYSNWMDLCLNFSSQNKELAICGKNATDYLTKLNQEYLPNLVLVGSNHEANLPFLVHKFVENKTLFYLCQNKSCASATEDFDFVLKSLL